MKLLFKHNVLYIQGTESLKRESKVQLVKQIDDFLFAKFFQRATDWLVEKRDTSNYAVASICITTAIAGILGWLLSVGFSPSMFFCIASGFVWGLVSRRCQVKHELWVTDRLPRPEPMRTAYRSRTLSTVVVLCLQIDSLLLFLEGIQGLAQYAISVVRDIGIISFLYFYACTPKPRKPQEKEEEVPAGYAPQAS